MNDFARRSVDVLVMIEEFIEENGYAPTLREIAKPLRLSSGAVVEHLNALKRAGCIAWADGKARTIRVLRSSDEVLAERVS